MQDTHPTDPPEGHAGTPGPVNADRWTLVRDIAVLQVKLIVDGLRDFLLVPVSLVAGIISLVKSDETQSNEFYDLLRLGRRSERWINLFGAAEKVHGPSSQDEEILPDDIDTMVSKVESYVVEEYKKGDMPKQAKDQIDRAIESLQKIVRKNRDSI